MTDTQGGHNDLAATSQQGGTSIRGWPLAAICALLLLTLIPRFFDILKFLPNYSIDENDIVEFAVGFLGGDLDPHWYKYGPLYAYLLSVIYLVESLFHSGGGEDFVQQIFFHPTTFYYAARFVNSCLNIALAFLTYRVAKRYFGQRVATVSLFLAVFPFFDSLVDFKIRVDTLLAFWAVLTIYFSLGIWESSRFRYYVLSGVFLGLGMATKPLPGLLVLPSVLLAHFLRSGRPHRSAAQRNAEAAKQQKRKSRRKQNRERREKPRDLSRWGLPVLLVSAVVSVFVFNPYSLVNFGGFFNEQIAAIRSEGGRGFAPGWDVTRFFSKLGYAFVLISIVSLLYVLYRSIRERNGLGLVLASYPVVLWLAFARGAARDYFYVPILPVLIILTARAISDVSEAVAKRNAALRPILVSGALLLLIAQPAVGIAAHSIRLNSTGDCKESHTEIAGKQWIEETLPRNASILLYGYYVSLPRLVDFDAKRQAQFGEYFMYYRWKNRFLRTQFAEAHRAYLRQNRPTFALANIRYDLREKEKELFGYCTEAGFDYVVSYHDLTRYPEFEERVYKRFDRSGFPFGREFTVYKMSHVPR